MDYQSSKLTSTYLRSRKMGMNHKIVVQAIKELGLEVADIVWGASIGCAGRQTFGTWKGDGFAGTHGRVYAIARGLRIAMPPEKKIILTVGDGDAFGIGIAHLIHAARSNADMTVIVNDNLGYQSTGGQYGWTTPQGSKTDSSPQRCRSNFFGPSCVDGRCPGGGDRKEGHPKQRILIGAYALPVSHQFCIASTRVTQSGQYLQMDPGPCGTVG
jgi:hypothetical protein